MGTASALPLTWRADWPDAKPVETLVHRGTDIELQPTWFINKAPADTNGWTYTTFCQTNAVGPWFGPLPGAFFSHTNDVGAAFYNVMVRAQTPAGAVNYTAFARLRMLDSPGFAPGELPLPAKTIDFSKVVAVNAPWLLPDATNGFIKVEVDPTVPAWAKAASAPLPPDYATVSNKAMTALQSFTEVDPTVPAWAKAASAPLPPNYATVSNKAMSALQSFTEADPHFREWANAHIVQTPAGQAVDWASDSFYAQTLGGDFSDQKYTAEDITAISNGFAAADAFLSSRLSLASRDATNYTDTAIGAAITNTNPVFSNAVLSVGLGIDTNTVAAINALVEAGDELPIGGVTSVGALLLALAAAVAALKRTKADASALRYAIPTAITASATLTDRAINNVTCGASAITLTLPAATSGYARDLLIRVDRTASGNAGVTFSATDAGSAAVSYETDDGSMPAVDDGAVTLLSFTEVSAGRFLVAAKQVQGVA